MKGDVNRLRSAAQIDEFFRSRFEQIGQAMVVFSLELKYSQFCTEGNCNAAGETEFNFVGNGFSVIIFVFKGIALRS